MYRYLILTPSQPRRLYQGERRIGVLVIPIEGEGMGEGGRRGEGGGWGGVQKVDGFSKFRKCEWKKKKTWEFYNGCRVKGPL